MPSINPERAVIDRPSEEKWMCERRLGIDLESTCPKSSTADATGGHFAEVALYAAAY